MFLIFDRMKSMVPGVAARWAFTGMLVWMAVSWVYSLNESGRVPACTNWLSGFASAGLNRQRR